MSMSRFGCRAHHDLREATGLAGEPRHRRYTSRRNSFNKRSILGPYGGRIIAVPAHRDCTNTGFSLENRRKPNSPW